MYFPVFTPSSNKPVEVPRILSLLHALLQPTYPPLPQHQLFKLHLGGQKLATLTPHHQHLEEERSGFR